MDPSPSATAEDGRSQDICEHLCERTVRLCISGIPVLKSDNGVAGARLPPSPNRLIRAARFVKKAAVNDNAAEERWTSPGQSAAGRSWQPSGMSNRPQR